MAASDAVPCSWRQIYSSSGSTSAAVESAFLTTAERARVRFAVAPADLCAVVCGDHVQAAAVVEKCVTVQRRLGIRYVLAVALSSLGEAVLDVHADDGSTS